MLRAGLSVRSALQIFATQRLRTALAMLGVFLGALLLTVIAHILGSVGLLIENEARALGSHVATVTASRPAFSREKDRPLNAKERDAAAQKALSGDSEETPLAAAATLTRAQLAEAVDAIPQIAAGEAFAAMKGQIVSDGKSSSCEILGVTPGYTRLRNAHTAHGRFFSRPEEEQKALVGVLGHALAERLFGDPSTAVGQHVRLEYSRVLILGVMEGKGADSSGTNMDEYLFLPLATFMQRFSANDHVGGFYLGMRTRQAAEHIERAVGGLLRARHRLAAWQKDDFSIAFAGKVDDMIENAVELISTLGFIGAGISFAVGTLGVFSIMILMVHARKTEIGIRRALGASRRIILRQFLWEAGLMAGVGGILGVIAALGLAGLIAALGLLPLYVNLALAAGICLLSILCGVLAGGYPAWKASRLEIIAALRE